MTLDVNGVLGSAPVVIVTICRDCISESVRVASSNPNPCSFCNQSTAFFTDKGALGPPSRPAAIIPSLICLNLTSSLEIDSSSAGMPTKDVSLLLLSSRALIIDSGRGETVAASRVLTKEPSLKAEITSADPPKRFPPMKTYRNRGNGGK